MPRTPRQKPHDIAVAILLGSFVICMGIIFGTIIYTLSDKNNNEADAKRTFENITYVKVHDSPSLGDKQAPVTIVEYTDFECPICKQVFDQILPKLKKEYIDTHKVLFVFKSLPIEEFHKNALRKTEAAFCAREQGGDTAFFTFYDSLFEKFNFNYGTNPDIGLHAIAFQNSLDVPAFQSCLQSNKYEQPIKKDIVEATVIGSYGTPTWLIGKSNKDGLTDTVKISGLLEYTVYKTIIDHLLTQ